MAPFERSYGYIARKFVTTLAIAVVVGLGILAVSGVRDLKLRREHRFELERIEKWVREAKSSAKETKVEDEWARTESLTAIAIALGNYPLCYPKLAPTERVRALADYLDRTKASDLTSLIGTLRFLSRLERVCPGGEQNGAVASIRDLQRRGELPCPPEGDQSQR